MAVPEEARQAAIDAMTQAFTAKGVEPGDAQEAATMLVDEAIQRVESLFSGGAGSAIWHFTVYSDSQVEI
jgi:hypothetical protein